MTPSPLPAPHQSVRRAPVQRPPAQRPLGVLLGAVALAAFALIPQDRLFLSSQSVGQPPWASKQSQSESCHAVLNADQRLSRAQLTQFLGLAEATAQATVHEKIAPPYCRLSRAHQAKQREAYPLSFDPDTWFVVNYDQGQYTDFDFIFKQ